MPMKKKEGFTLAEALMTLAVIGVVSTLVIPSVITNSKRTQYATAYKKAVKTVNEAITMNIAKGEKSALSTTSNNTLFTYLQKNMDVISSTTQSKYGTGNSAFYTPDGMRFEFPASGDTLTDKTGGNILGDITFNVNACGTYGLGIGGGTKALKNEPCIIAVDVNGDKKPNIAANNEISDIFLILVTDKTALPYGDIAQKAYYNQ